MSVYNVTHSSDIDGLASAALLVRNYGVPLENVFFINYSGRIFEEAVRAIKKIKGSGNVLIITDFGADKSIFEKEVKAIENFKKKGNAILWFDHHPWEAKQTEKMSKYCDVLVNGELHLCGAELVQRFLCRKDGFNLELARIAHLADFAIYPKKYYKLIWNLNYAQKILGKDETAQSGKLRKLVSLIAQGRYSDNYIITAAERYIRRSKPYMDALMKGVHVEKLNGVKLAIGFSEKISSQVACIGMLERFRADVAVYVPIDSGRCSIRCKSRIDRKEMVRVGGVDGSKLARALGGGGHPLASGFAIKTGGKRLAAAEMEKSKDWIIDNARKIYGK